jgi:MOSC domain-containing protein YiiM
VANDTPPPHLVSIHLVPAPGGSAHEVDSVNAVAGCGLDGDRYFVAPAGSRDPRTCDVTLIELEAIEAVARDAYTTIAPGDTRRNLVTRGVPLNHLVGATFQVGSVTLRGNALSEPCSHLAGLTYPEIREHLAHRAGLEATIIEGGELRPGDPITF